MVRPRLMADFGGYKLPLSELNFAGRLRDSKTVKDFGVLERDVFRRVT